MRGWFSHLAGGVVCWGLSDPKASLVWQEKAATFEQRKEGSGVGITDLQ